MTNESLAQSYLRKASDRLDVLEVFFNKGAYSDVVREAQELVELALKGMLRAVGIEPPKRHDVGGLLLDCRERFPEDMRPQLADLPESPGDFGGNANSRSTATLISFPRKSIHRRTRARARQEAERILQAARRVIESKA